MKYKYNINVLSYPSLPAISETILCLHRNNNLPPITTFPMKYGHLNTEIRQHGIIGGLRKVD